jgi:hypothetical protein
MSPTQARPSGMPLRFLGTWQLTHWQSSHPDIPHPLSGTTSFTREGEVIHYEAETRWSDGRSSSARASLKLDGTWSAVTGSVLADSVSFQQVDDSAFTVDMRKSGDHAGSSRTRVSATGRTMTTDWEIPGPEGSTITWRTTSERQ